MFSLRLPVLSAAFGAALLGAAAPAWAGELVDVRVLPDGRVWIALSETPVALSVEAGSGRVALVLSGVALTERRIEPAIAAGFSLLTVAPAAEGGVIVLTGQFDGASAELREGGVLVALEGAIPTAPPRLAAAAPPVSPAAHAASAGEIHGQAQAQASASASAEHASTAAHAAGQAGGPALLQPDSAAPSSSANTPSHSAPSPAPAPAAPAGPCAETAAPLAGSPWDLGLLSAHGDCLAAAGERAEAEAIYERVLAFEPEHFAAALGLARIKQETGRGGEAAALFETAAGSAMTDGEALAARAAARRAREGGD